MEPNEINRWKRDSPPAHYILKIKSFSEFYSKVVEETETEDDAKYESDEFEAADYKWKLVLYPNGDVKRNGEGHISLYLASTDEKVISNIGCPVNVLVTFFVYDHIRDNYLTIQDGKTKRYNVLSTEHGFDQLIPLVMFIDPTNGYLLDDCCIFGAEVIVINEKVKGNEFSFITDPPNGTFTWKIEKFSTLENKAHYSEAFIVGGRKWNLLLWPNGELEEKDRSLSLYLSLEEEYPMSLSLSDLDAYIRRQSKVYVEYYFSLKDQLNGIHLAVEDYGWFENSDSWGYESFIQLKDLYDASKGFLVNDTLVIETKITLISVSQDLICLD